MAAVSVTQGELLAALATAIEGVAPEDARTAIELSAEAGIGLPRIRVALALLQAQGRLQLHHVRRPAIDGRMAKVPAYTILPKKRRS